MNLRRSLWSGVALLLLSAGLAIAPTAEEQAAAAPSIAGETIASGGFHTCAIQKDTTVKCWGYNFNGQLGDGTAGGSTGQSALTVHGFNNQGILTGATQITAGASHTCALLSDGTVACWGRNDSGQLGVGSAQYPYPTIVEGFSYGKYGSGNTLLGTLTGVVQVSAGTNSTCAVLADSTAACWGDGLLYQLGNPSNAIARSPKRVQSFDGIGNLTGVKQITAGFYQSCALLTDNTVACWGTNTYGGIGHPGLSQSAKPVRVVGTSG